MTAELSAAMICIWFAVDHSFDHLRLWTTWKQCWQEHPKASFSDTKAPKSLLNQGKNRCRFVWEQDVAGSNPVIPTKKQPKTSYFYLFSAVFLYIFHEIGCFQLTTCLPNFFAFYWIFHCFFIVFWKSLFFAYCIANFEGWPLFGQPLWVFISARQIGICLSKSL